MRKPAEETPLLAHLLPGQVYVRVYLLTQSDDIVQAYKGLCDMGYMEYADMLLTAVMTAGMGGRGGIGIHKIPHPLREMPYKCTAVKEGDRAYLVMVTRNLETGENNFYCYVYEKEVDRKGSIYHFLRACNYEEYTRIRDSVKSIIPLTEFMEEELSV